MKPTEKALRIFVESSTVVFFIPYLICSRRDLNPGHELGGLMSSH